MTRKPSQRHPDPDLAALLKLIRTRYGSSQAAVARRSDCDRSLVSLIESANRHPTPEIFSTYLHLTRKDSIMRRRLLLAAAAAGITGALTADDTLEHVVDQALGPDIDAWDARIAALGQDNMRYGSAIMRPQIGNVIGELFTAPHNNRLSPHKAKVLMLFARTQPDPTTAITWYNNATTAADQTNDSTTIAWTYGRAALAAGGEEQTAHLAPHYADRAIATGHTGDPLADIGIYMAYAARARGWANLGDWDHTLTACEEAMRAYDRIDPDIDGTEYSYSAWRHAITISYPLSLIGHPDADRWSTEAYQLGATGRFDTHLRLHEAIRRYRAGDPAAPDAARAAMDAASGDQTTLILRTMAAQAGASEYHTLT